MAPPPGIKRFDRIQLGKETTSGTLVPATTRWRGTGAALEDQRKLEIIDEMVGYMGGVDRTIITQNMGGLTLSPTPATPEQFQYLWAMAMGGPTTGAADGAGTDKVYANTIPTTANVTLKSYSLEGGDDKEQESAAYAVCKSITLEGKAGESAKMSGVLLTRGVNVLGGFTSVVLPAVSELPTSQGKVYLDVIGGTAGTTQIASQIMGFKLQYDFMVIPKPTMDGSLDWTFAVLTDWKISGEITFEHDTAVLRSGGAIGDFVTQTAKILQLKLLGIAVGTPGTTYSNRQIVATHPIKWLNPPPLSDVSGNNTIVMKFQSRNNLTFGGAGSVVVVNELDGAYVIRQGDPMLHRNGYSSATEELTEEDETAERAYHIPAAPRQLGRAVPPVEELHFEIKLDGQVIGTVYPKRLTGAAQLDLEDAKSTRHVIAWLVTYANGDAARVETMLRELPLAGITAFVRSTMNALEQSIALGNESGPR
jgi:hypothetical protein